MIACSTGDEDGGGCGWDEDPYCCRAVGGTYSGGFGFQERLGWFLQLGLYVLLYGAMAGGLWLVLAHSISLFSHHIPY